MLYFDTDALRKLGTAFQTTALPSSVRAKVVLSPVSALEILSQLTIAKPEEVLRSIHGIRNLLLDQAAILDWPDAFIANHLFDLKTQDDTYAHVGEAINACLCADTPDQVSGPAGQLKDLLDRAKTEQTAKNEGFITLYRKAPAAREERLLAFAQAMAKRVGADHKDGSEAKIGELLSAYFEFQDEILRRAVANQDYSFAKHSDRLFDSEQLVYLADPRLHLVTGDAGFRCAGKSPQAARIHIVKHDILTNAEEATALLTKLAAADC